MEGVCSSELDADCWEHVRLDYSFGHNKLVRTKNDTNLRRTHLFILSGCYGLGLSTSTRVVAAGFLQVFSRENT